MIYGAATGAARGRLRKVRSWIRKAQSVGRRARELGAGRVLLLVQTFVLLLAAKVALQVLPVRTIMNWKQRAVRELPGQVSPAADLEAELGVVRHAVLVVARYSPVKFICFPQCLAASALLRARGIASRLHYGVAREDGRLVTHTWLEAEGEIVIGGEVAGDYARLAVY